MCECVTVCAKKRLRSASCYRVSYCVENLEARNDLVSVEFQNGRTRIYCTAERHITRCSSCACLVQAQFKIWHGELLLLAHNLLSACANPSDSLHSKSRFQISKYRLTKDNVIQRSYMYLQSSAKSSKK